MFAYGKAAFAGVGALILFDLVLRGVSRGVVSAAFPDLTAADVQVTERTLDSASLLNGDTMSWVLVGVAALVGVAVQHTATHPDSPDR